MTASHPTLDLGCRHESVQLFGRVDAVGCALTALRCVDCGRLLHEGGST